MRRYPPASILDRPRYAYPRSGRPSRLGGFPRGCPGMYAQLPGLFVAYRSNFYRVYSSLIIGVTSWESDGFQPLGYTSDRANSWIMPDIAVHYRRLAAKVPSDGGDYGHR